MSEPTPSTSNRRLSRRRPPKGRVRVICQRGALELGPNLALGIVDLSETGACLRLKEALAPRQEVSISLEGPANVRPVRRLARVVWCVPVPEGGEYRAGVDFEKRMEYRDYLDLS